MTQESENDRADGNKEAQAAPKEPEKKEDGARAETASAAEEKAGRKRGALIFLLCLLVAAAVMLPLTLIDFSKTPQTVIDKSKKTITYSRADFSEDIWANEEYKAAEKTVCAYVDGIRFERSFDSLAQANEVFSALEELPCGGKTLGRYFAAMINGLDKQDAQDYAALFSKDCERTPASRFPAQKICRIELEYRGRNASTRLHEWRTYMQIMNNDGLAVDYLGERDAGYAWICLEESSGEYFIKRIDTIYKMN